MSDPAQSGHVLSRRSLFEGGAAAALSAASYRRVLGANDRMGLGFIGFGLIGKRHVLDFKDQPDAGIVAHCRGPQRPPRRGRRTCRRIAPAATPTFGPCSMTRMSTQWSSRRPTTGTP